MFTKTNSSLINNFSNFKDNMFKDQCPSPSLCYNPATGRALGCPLWCSVCWKLYCHLSSPNGLVLWGIRYGLPGTLMLWYIYALGCILLSRQIQTLKYYQGYSMLSPFTNQVIALTASFAISPCPRTHFIFISTPFVMTDLGIYTFPCTLLFLC